MKVILTLAATSLVLTANGVQAQNDPVVGAGATAPTISFAPMARQFVEKSGVFLTIEGQNAWSIDNGKKIAAEDGGHELVDGKVITVKNGKVVGALPESGVVNPASLKRATD